MSHLTRTATLDGPEPALVDVEVSSTSGFAGLHLVGNTGDLCRDGKERAKTALEKLGLRLGHKRILISLAPADRRKEGNHFDLAIAVSLASWAREEPLKVLPSDFLFAAELGLEGELRPIRGVIPMLLCARQQGLKGIVMAAAQQSDLAVLEHWPEMRENVRLLYFHHLRDVLVWLFEGRQPDQALAAPDAVRVPRTALADFSDMQLTSSQQRVAEACALGRHSLLLRGTPGTGKSMFAARLPSLLPRLAAERQLEVLELHSLQHERLPLPLLEGYPPFRHPHHSSSPQALLGTAHEPGDLALAHGGILFLDELPEFRRDLLEALREPLEYGSVSISRAQRKVKWRSQVQLIAACNNCPCGWFGSEQRLCRCSTQKLMQYWGRLSGPILDRIDIHFNMPELSTAQQSWSAPSGAERQERMQAMLDRLERAREFAAPRHQHMGTRDNTDIQDSQLFAALDWSRDRRAEMVQELEKLQLSHRSFVRCLRVARTLADLDRSQLVLGSHVQEAAQWQHLAAAKARGETLT